MKTNRPSDLDQQWASDANFPAGAELWNGTPTKVAPSAGEVAGGWKPDRRVPAAWANHRENRTDRAFAYIDAFDATNYGRKLLVGTVAIPATGMLNGYCTAFDAYHGMHYALFNLEMLKSNSDGEGTWSDVTSLIPGAISNGRGIAFNPTTGVGYIIASNGAARSSPSSAGSTWGSIAVANMSDARGIIWDPYRGRFVAFGLDTFSDPSIWTLDDVAATKRTLTGAGSFSFPIYQLAAGADRLVAIHGTAADFRVWTSLDGDTWTVNNPAISAGSYVLDYDDGRNEFVLVAGSAVFTSGDGTVWLNRTPLGIKSGSMLLVNITGIVTYGGLWVVAGQTSIVGEPLTNALMVSRDQGASWELVRPAVGVIRSISRQGGRIWLVNDGVTTGTAMQFGLRAR